MECWFPTLPFLHLTPQSHLNHFIKVIVTCFRISIKYSLSVFLLPWFVFSSLTLHLQRASGPWPFVLRHRALCIIHLVLLSLHVMVFLTAAPACTLSKQQLYVFKVQKPTLSFHFSRDFMWRLLIITAKPLLIQHNNFKKAMLSYSFILNILYTSCGSCSLNVHGGCIYCQFFQLYTSPAADNFSLFTDVPRELFVEQHWTNSWKYKRIPDLYYPLIQQVISTLFPRAGQKKQPEGHLWVENENLTESAEPRRTLSLYRPSS